MTRTLIAAAALVTWAAPLSANVGPPSTGGQVAGEPVGIRHVRIVRESLAIDLRPVSQNEGAAVEATYRLHNDGPEQSLALRFASGSEGVTGFEVAFDSRSVPVAPATGEPVPVSWKPPKLTPGFGGAPGVAYSPGQYSGGGVKSIGFTLAVPPGDHLLTVRYRATTATYHPGVPVVYRQFAYVLAPARSWDGFGGLDVTVHLPAGWEAAVDPELTRDGDTLRGSFPGLPADSLAITFRAPEGRWYQPLTTITQVLFGVVGFGGLIVAWLAGLRRGHRAARAVVAGSPHVPRIWPWAVGVGLLWGAGVLVTGLLAVHGPDAALPEGQVGGYGYGKPIASIGVFLLAPNVAVLGFLVAYFTGTVTLRLNGESQARDSGEPDPERRPV